MTGRTFAAALLLSGCRAVFGMLDPTPTAPDAAPDGPPDVPAITSCSVNAASSTGIDRGMVGIGLGGGINLPLACSGDDRIVGISLDMSDNNVNGQNSRSARGLRINCATLTIDAAGPHLGLTTSRIIDGNGGAGWSPSTLTPLTSCPAGSVMSGLKVYGGQVMTLFLDATMMCTPIDAQGHSGTPVSLYVTGSQTSGENPSSATCAAGEHVVSMTTTTGAGFDSLHLFCSPTTCKSVP